MVLMQVIRIVIQGYGTSYWPAKNETHLKPIIMLKIITLIILIKMLWSYKYIIVLCFIVIIISFFEWPTASLKSSPDRRLTGSTHPYGCHCTCFARWLMALLVVCLFHLLNLNFIRENVFNSGEYMHFLMKFKTGFQDICIKLLLFLQTLCLCFMLLCVLAYSDPTQH